MYERIEEIRKYKKITQPELSKKIGLSVSGYRLALKNNTLKVRDLKKIAEVLNVDIIRLFSSHAVENMQVAKGNDISQSINGKVEDSDRKSLKEKIRDLERIIKDKERIIKDKERIINLIENK